jgi:hypothetical protein
MNIVRDVTSVTRAVILKLDKATPVEPNGMLEPVGPATEPHVGRK